MQWLAVWKDGSQDLNRDEDTEPTHNIKAYIPWYLNAKYAPFNQELPGV